MQPTTTTTDLMGAILDLAGDLDIRSLLERFVAASTAMTGAPYGAINIVDDHGASVTFVQSGVDPETVAALGHPPHAFGVLGEIPDEGVLRLEDLTHHPAFRGLPPGHPPMGSFLGTAVRVQGSRYGTLYLADKAGGFTDDDESVVRTLAAAAAVAVQNAELYAVERRREGWLTAGQQITTMLLEGADQEDVLERIAATARAVDGADACALVLPGRDEALVVEIVDGPAPAPDLFGVDLSESPRVRSAFDTGAGHVVPSLATAPDVVPALAGFGPALFAPMTANGRGMGVLLLLRRRGAPPFTSTDLALSQTFAAQAALAFLLADARDAQGRAVLHDERTRIARDLHDLAIQQLFAAGIRVDAMRTRGEHALSPQVDAELATVAAHVDAGIRQIRVIVRALDDPHAALSLVHRLQSEVELATSSLGFRPALQITLDGTAVDTDVDDRPAAAETDALLAPGRANNVVAVVREGLSNTARHARPRSVTVRVAVTSGADGAITVEVEDDGVGIPAAPARASGTKNLAARAEQSGGTFMLLRPPSGQGALLRWTAPLD